MFAGLFGSTIGFHSIAKTSLSKNMGAGGRGAVFVAISIGVVFLLFGNLLINLIPRFVVGGGSVDVGAGIFGGMGRTGLAEITAG